MSLLTSVFSHFKNSLNSMEYIFSALIGYKFWLTYIVRIKKSNAVGTSEDQELSLKEFLK